MSDETDDDPDFHYEDKVEDFEDLTRLFFANVSKAVEPKLFQKVLARARVTYNPVPVEAVQAFTNEVYQSGVLTIQRVSNFNDVIKRVDGVINSLVMAFGKAKIVLCIPEDMPPELYQLPSSMGMKTLAGICKWSATGKFKPQTNVH